MKIQYSDRLEQLPPYLFAEIDALKEKLIHSGKDIIDLSVGDPDLPTPDFIIDGLKSAAVDPKNHRYPFGPGMLQFRTAVAKWYSTRFGVKLDPETEVLALIGSKEGIGHVPLAFINPGDTVLIPNPCYPVYPGSVVLAGGVPHYMPLLEENDFLPDFSDIPATVLESARLMFLNYPNNPTTAVAGEGFYKSAVEFAHKNNIIICHDAAYSEIAYDGYKPMSFLSVPGAKETGIEFHSLSKTFNMTGWRIGFAVGNSEILKGLARIKNNVDSGIWRPIQCAGTIALEKGPVHLVDAIKIYKERMDILANGLMDSGWKVIKPKATFYLWVKVQPGMTSKELSKWFLEKMEVVVAPGTGFGSYGEGYIRFSVTTPTERIKEVLTRLVSASNGSRRL